MSAAYGLSFMVLTTIKQEEKSKQEEEKSKQEEEKSKQISYEHNTKEIEMVPLSFSSTKQYANSCFEPILSDYCNL